MADVDVKCSSFAAQAHSGRFLYAVQHVSRLRGGTQAHLMRGSDGKLYAVKFQNNPKSARALVSEFLATRLGCWLGLPMPKVEIIEVSDWLVNHDLLRIEAQNRLTRCASGRQLALRYTRDAVLSVPQRSFRRVMNAGEFVRALAFDKWTGNCDNRQAVFVKEDSHGYGVTFIDQHNCFNAGQWTFPDQPYFGTYNELHVYASVTGWQSFEPTLSLIENISPFDLWKFATEIPPEWYEHDGGALSRLVDRLYRRRLSVRDLLTKIRMSDLNPFPNWVN